MATNIIIAFSAATATAIHLNSMRLQRKDRLWDINKNILLDLSHTLSLVIKASEFYLQREYALKHLGDEPPAHEKPKDNVFKDFEEKQEYALSVYKGLMDKELITSLEKAKIKNEEIDLAVSESGVDIISAYEASIETNKELQEKLSFFIAKIAGVGEI